MKEEIGTVTISYDKTGKVIRANFVPVIKVNMGEELLKELKGVQSESDEASMVEDANTVFAGWFNKFNTYELADRDKFEIVTEKISCEKYLSGEVKKAVIKFIFQERS